MGKMTDVHDTIVALSSAAGVGGRAVVRLSGPRALDIALTTFHAAESIERGRRHWIEGQVTLPPPLAALPAGLMIWPGPKTYTSQDIVELHTLCCPPLVELLIAQLLQAGARAAQPGEFTQRAFLAGKLDLTQAEAVLAVIEASSRSELDVALAHLAGGLSTPLAQLRSNLLDLLADVEAALDFADEDLQFVDEGQLLTRLARGLAQVTNLQRQLGRRAVSDAKFRVVIVGRPNAGKSSLFNALAGRPAALVSPAPGTTRDYLVRTLALDDIHIELTDTAGWLDDSEPTTQQAQRLALERRRTADLLVLCVESGRPLLEDEKALLEQTEPEVLALATKCDLAAPQPNLFATSALTGQGIAELKVRLADKARAHAQPALAPSLARCRHHIEACLGHLRRAHAAVVDQLPPELLALTLREAIDELGVMVGAVYTDDLLDRIFSRFCVGK
jgi:tRNA modification GTPase